MYATNFMVQYMNAVPTRAGAQQVSRTRTRWPWFLEAMASHVRDREPVSKWLVPCLLVGGLTAAALLRRPSMPFRVGGWGP